MIKPESIDLASLPWLPLEEKAAFPKRPSIYFAIDNWGDVQYIGRSVNTKQRWAQHHKYATLSSMVGVRIAYLFVDAPELLPEIEKALIQWFQPPLNFIDNQSSPMRQVKSKPRKTCNTEITTVRHPEVELLKVFLQLPTVAARQQGATELRIFLLEEEKEFLKQVAAKKGITLSHLMRSLSLAWANQHNEDESA